MSDQANPQPGAASTTSNNDRIMKKVRIAAIPVLLTAGAYGYFHRNAVDCGSSNAQDLVVQIAKDHEILVSAVRYRGNGTGAARDTSCDQDAACAKAAGEAKAAYAAAKDLASQCLAIPRQEGFDECPEVSETAENFTTNAPDHWGTSLPDQDGNLTISSARKAFMDTKAPALLNRLNVAEKAKANAEKALQASNAAKASSAWADAVKSLQYRLENIIMTDKNEQTGAVMCKATLFGSVEGWGEKSLDIQYSVEKTSDGKLFATLYGR